MPDFSVLRSPGRESRACYLCRFDRFRSVFVGAGRAPPGAPVHTLIDLRPKKRPRCAMRGFNPPLPAFV